MKAVFEDITSKRGDTSFVAYHSEVPYFEFKWHYHPEYELTLITRGNGKRLVGDSYENFETGDLVLLGSGLPHTWMSNPENENTSAVVIQFSENFIGSFLRLPEFLAIQKLLKASSSGLYFHSGGKVVPKISLLPDAFGTQKVLLMLEILQDLCSLDSTPLSSGSFIPARGKDNEDRINKVFGYIQQHASETITLEETAALVHLSKSAFCKFFRRVTGKTFTDYVNDIRIANSTRLLTESDKTIAETAFASGFDSLTYFNRVFLRKKGMTPGTFRKSIRR